MARKFWRLPVPKAGWDSVSVLPEMDMIVVVPDKEPPVRVMPGESPAVLETEARVLPEEVVPPLTVRVPPAVV